ncbi:hypothetical protein Pyn_20229 [Prunus yedoensis var. nudiflora]|uniref:Uncharacterized protein n=1 Tax=Prunus yedoensis var. nudiflora TaxID=2094558 RepID=A0A314YQV3_PRUYE|nr:hypothetical protein Pyn_20229 [Prunus yedoensis var. nudiflora]
MVAEKLATTKRGWLTTAGMLAAAKRWRLMAGMAAGMLAAAKKRKENEFSWLLGGLQQPRDGWFWLGKCHPIYRG